MEREQKYTYVYACKRFSFPTYPEVMESDEILLESSESSSDRVSDLGRSLKEPEAVADDVNSMLMDSSKSSSSSNTFSYGDVESLWCAWDEDEVEEEDKCRTRRSPKWSEIRAKLYQHEIPPNQSYANFTVQSSDFAITLLIRLKRCRGRRKKSSDSVPRPRTWKAAQCLTSIGCPQRPRESCRASQLTPEQFLDL